MDYSRIQLEQQQLLKVEKELQSALIRVNESINALKVEELQLQSNEVIAMQASSDAHRNAQHLQTVSESIQKEADINKQQIDIGHIDVRNIIYDVEEEDDS